jgi:hypothetical protein
MADMSLTLASYLPDDALSELTRDLKIGLLQNGLIAPAPATRPTMGERGDPVTIGVIALAAFSSGGAVGSLIKCLQAILARDRTLRIKLKIPKGPDIEIDGKNISTAELRASIEAAMAAARS